MRDPYGRAIFVGQEVVRQVQGDRSALRFLNGNCAEELVRSGRLLSYSSDGTVLRSPRLPLVTFPHEWSDAQLRSAARLTLDISTAILAEKHELKDASAWNVIFDGCIPLFCDHLSFQPITLRYWWAFGQFTRHFVLPLGISQVRDLKAYQALTLFRDGLPADVARNWLGWRRFSTKLWPLLIDGRSSIQRGARDGATLHENLYEYCSFLLADKRARGKRKDHRWSTYQQDRDHYSAAAVAAKRERVASWMDAIKPGWVLDLGCNQGEFCDVALARGASVIALDSDHDCIESIFLRGQGKRHLFPVIADLGDILGGRGWMGEEFTSLADRLSNTADVVLMLALTHHLAINESIPVDEIARLASQVTRRYAIVEIVGSVDAVRVEMAAKRRREVTECDARRERQAFEVYFQVVDTFDIPSMSRSLVLLEKKR